MTLRLIVICTKRIDNVTMSRSNLDGLIMLVALLITKPQQLTEIQNFERQPLSQVIKPSFK